MILQSWQPQEDVEELTYDTHIRRIRVTTTAKGTKFYVGITRDLLFYPGRWRWDSGKPLMSYSTKLGRLTLNPRRQLSKPIPEKWHRLLSMTYQPRWKDVWNKHRPRKDAGFL
jgi:hypothetical protein